MKPHQILTDTPKHKQIGPNCWCGRTMQWDSYEQVWYCPIHQYNTIENLKK